MNRKKITNKILIILLSIAGAVPIPINKLWAQTPGGITGIQTEYWLRADQVQTILPADGADVITWQDLSGNGRDFSSPTSYNPKFNKSSMNFHSAVDFYFLDSSEGGPTDAQNRQRKLQTTTNFAADVSKSYFVIWVSKLDKDNTGSYATVFSLNRSSSSGTTNESAYGWRGGTGTNGGRLYHATRGTQYTHSSTTERDFGIGIAVLPNVTGTAQQEYINALASTTTMNGRVLNTTAQPSIIGGANVGTGTTDYFFGEVMEIIVLSKNGTGNTLTTDELKKINTHLAIKYGVCLDATQTDYIFSDGTSIYNSTSAGYTSYNKDIFGIARDNASGLYQKQSASTDNPALTVYLGSTLAETNEENTSILNDKYALMFGANGLIGNASYSHDVGTAFQNYTLQQYTDPSTGAISYERLSILFKYQLKAKTTGQSSYTINMKPGQGEWVLVGSDPTFAPTNTRIYKVEQGTASDVVVNDGDYIGFASFIKAPAGIANGLVMWLNAAQRNTITLNGAGEVIDWVDHSGYGTSFSKITSNSTAPLYNECDEQMNYHPSVFFRQSRQYLSTRKGPFSVAAPNDYTIFTTLNANFNTSNRIYFTSYGALTRSLYPALGVREGSSNLEGRARIYDGGGAGAVDGTTILFNGGATTAMTHTMKKNTYFRLYADGYMQQMNESAAGRGSRMNGPGVIGYGGSSDSRTLIGVISEHIAYEGEISDADRDKIDAYLGLKYGITIDKDKLSNATNFDFKISDGTSVWNGNDVIHQNYHKNVASVLRDDASDLNNRQSKSTDVGAIVHMGVGSVLGCSPTLNDIINDKSAITWGHNSGALTTLSFAGDPNICGALDSRLNGRVWLVDNINFSQSIAVRAEGSTFPYNGANWEVYMLVADDPAKIISNNWDQLIPMTYYEGGHQANYVFSKKYTYISFAAKQLPGTCEGCEFSGSKKLEFTNANWTRGTVSGTYNLGDSFTAEVSTSIESPSVFVTRYPRASNYNSLREYRRRGTGTNKMTTKVVLSKAAAATFEIYEIDRRSTRYSDVEVYGKCGGSIVSPTLSYVDKESNSSYTITGNHAKANRRTASYTARRGRMFVEFENPVEEIYVVHTYRGSAGSGYKRIGIGAMEFICPQLLPEPTEDGLIFTKQGPGSILTCEEVNYTFRITNTNCAPYPVDFSDVLPAGMKWVSGSLSVDDAAVSSSAINSYGGSNTLSIGNLSVPSASTLTFRASAVFDMEAPTGVYSNRGEIVYESAINPGTNVMLQSCDRLTPGCEPTVTYATEVTDRPQFLQLAEFGADLGCYKEDKVISVTVKINNPNSFVFSGSDLDISYNEEFSFVSGSLSYTAGGLGTVDTSEAGNIFAGGFTIPSGITTITFKVKAPSKANLAYLKDENGVDILDSNGDPIVEPLDVSADFGLESDDICLQTSVTSLSGSFEIPYCIISKECIISNKNVTSKIKK
ncbi:MAG: cohesin domain-containing protein [Prevotella sp.]|nr:cohesin domain-containing protein [Prevotella sp.]